MKKIILCALVIAGLSLPSCKKDNICTCIVKNDVTGATISNNNFIIRDTKKKAKSSCNSLSSDVNGLAQSCSI